MILSLTVITIIKHIHIMNSKIDFFIRVFLYGVLLIGELYFIIVIEI